MQITRLEVAKEYNPSGHPDGKFSRSGDYFLLQFQAMASTCELLIDLPESEWALAEQLALQAIKETWRIEFKYSRYQKDNWHDRLHQSQGEWQNLDEESARLIAFSDQAWQLSSGLFDITSGILRQAWHFDGSDHLPEAAAINDLLPFIGWQKVQWRSSDNQPEDQPDRQIDYSNSAQNAARIYLPENMELDFGGIGKEYAVDRVLGLSLALLQQNDTTSDYALLVNFGGDIACSGPRTDGKPWMVAIESPEQEGKEAALLSLKGGALATSGDSQRYLLKDGKRYSHLLNPTTGWPIEDAVRSVTVAAPTCTQSGLIATLALLQGSEAEKFLRQTGLKYWLLS